MRIVAGHFARYATLIRWFWNIAWRPFNRVWARHHFFGRGFDSMILAIFLRSKKWESDPVAVSLKNVSF